MRKENVSGHFAAALPAGVLALSQSAMSEQINVIQRGYSRSVLN